MNASFDEITEGQTYEVTAVEGKPPSVDSGKMYVKVGTTFTVTQKNPGSRSMFAKFQNLEDRSNSTVLAGELPSSATASKESSLSEADLGKLTVKDAADNNGGRRQRKTRARRSRKTKRRTTRRRR